MISRFSSIAKTQIRTANTDIRLYLVLYLLLLAVLLDIVESLYELVLALIGRYEMSEVPKHISLAFPLFLDFAIDSEYFVSHRFYLLLLLQICLVLFGRYVRVYESQKFAVDLFCALLEDHVFYVDGLIFCEVVKVSVICQ